MTGLYIKLGAAAAVSAVFLILFFAAKSKLTHNAENKGAKRLKTISFIGLILGAWFLVASLFGLFIHSESITDILGEFSIIADRTEIFGISFATTSVTMWVITGIVLVLALIFRFLVLPKFSEDKPSPLQHGIETLVDFFDNFTHEKVEGKTGALSSYLISLAILMFGCAMAELFSLKAPTADIMVTFSMGLMTFFFINYYGIKNKKLSGRFKTLTSPSPILLPIKIVSDVAIPVSLACRLFGNMLGGMIVMDLLKGAAGSYSLGLAPIAGLYFNLFHPVIQIYIFVTLSLTFINEAVE